MDLNEEVGQASGPVPSKGVDPSSAQENSNPTRSKENSQVSFSAKAVLPLAATSSGKLRSGQTQRSGAARRGGGVNQARKSQSRSQLSNEYVQKVASVFQQELSSVKSSVPQSVKKGGKVEAEKSE